jgi:hypothetical protein
MKRLAPSLLAPALSVLAACGQQSPAENKADQLDEAAEQSDPAAAEVLENAADQVREQDSTQPAEGALENAANAAAPAPAPQDTMPPPKVPPDP